MAKSQETTKRSMRLEIKRRYIAIGGMKGSGTNWKEAKLKLKRCNIEKRARVKLDWRNY